MSESAPTIFMNFCMHVNYVSVDHPVITITKGNNRSQRAFRVVFAMKLMNFSLISVLINQVLLW